MASEHAGSAQQLSRLGATSSIMGQEEVEVFFHNDIINSCSKHSRKEVFEDQGTMTLDVASKIKNTPQKTQINNAWPLP